MYNVDLSWVDDGFSIKSHQVDILYILTETIHIIKVCVYGIKALYTSCSCCDHHVLSCSHELDSGSGDVCLKVFGVISTRKGNTEKSFGRFADIKCAHDTTCRLDRCHDQNTSFFTSEIFFSLDNFSFYDFYILCGLCLWNTDCIASTCDCTADIFFPVRCIQSVDSDNTFASSIVNGLKCMIKRKSCCIFLVLCNSIFQIKHDRIRFVNIRIFDQSRFLCI